MTNSVSLTYLRLHALTQIEKRHAAPSHTAYFMHDEGSGTCFVIVQGAACQHPSCWPLQHEQTNLTG